MDNQITTGGVRCTICSTVVPFGGSHSCGGSPLTYGGWSPPPRSSREERALAKTEELCGYLAVYGGTAYDIACEIRRILRSDAHVG